jgi:hypothetical protein
VKITEKKEPVPWVDLPTCSPKAWEVYGFDDGKKLKGIRDNS